MILYDYFPKSRPYLIILGSFLIHLSIGNYYTYGNIQKNIVNYMQNHSLSGNVVRTSNSLWIFGLLAFGMGSSITAGGFLAKKIGTSLTVLFGGWIMSTNVILAYFTIKTYLSVLALNYGLLAGIGAGLAYGVALGEPLKWFQNQKGLIIGLILAGFGLSSTIFGNIQESFIDRKNPEYLPESFVILGCSFAILQVLGSILLIDNFHTNRSKINSLEQSIPKEDSTALFTYEARSPSNEAELMPHQLIFEYDFWILWLTVLFSFSSIPIFTSLHHEFGNSMNLNRLFKHSATINIMVGICNASGRIFWGYLADRNPYKVMMIVVSLLNAAFMGSFYFISLIHSDIIRLIIFYCWVAIINFCQAGHFPIIATVCVKLFGLKNFVCNYGLLSTSRSICAIIISTISVSFELNVSNFKLCWELFTIGSAMSLLAAGITILFRGKSLILSR